MSSLSPIDPAVAETAVRVLKAAATRHLKCPTGFSDMAMRVIEEDGTIKYSLRTFLPDSERLTREVAETIVGVANELIAADTPVYKFQLPMEEAVARYGSAFQLSYRRVPKGTTTLELAYLPGLNIAYAPVPLLASTGALGRMELVDLTLNKNVKHGDVFIVRVHPAEGAAVPDPHPTCEPPTAEDIAVFNFAPPEKAKGPAVQAKKKDKHKQHPHHKYPGPSATGGGAAGGGAAAAAEAALVRAGHPTETTGPVVAADTPTQVVNPWEVSAGEDGVDYAKLIVDFGCLPLTEDLVSRVERLTGRRAHRFLRRGIFFAHRDLHLLLDHYERGLPFYLYTGRGPSSEALHMGHLIPFEFTRYLQEAFNVPVVIQLTDDEKFLWKDLELEECYRLGKANARDIIACGFDERKTFIFSDLEYMPHMYRNVLRIQKATTYALARNTFGFDQSSNIGKVAFPAVQAAPSFPSSFTEVLGDEGDMMCLIPQAIDQDPYFRLTRDVAPRLREEKPALVHSVFFPGLKGPKSKMSASTSSSAIFVTDDRASIARKVRKAYSGGPAVEEDIGKVKPNLEVDVAYQYLRFFLEDDEELAAIGRGYLEGELRTKDVKDRLAAVLGDLVEAHQERRALATEDVVERFMTVRRLEFVRRGAAGAATGDAGAAAAATTA